MILLFGEMISFVELLSKLFEFYKYIKENNSKKYDDFTIKIFINGLILGKQNIDLYDTYDTLSKIDHKDILTKRIIVERKKQLDEIGPKSKNIKKIIELKYNYLKSRYLRSFYAKPDLEISIDRDIKQIKYKLLSDDTEISIDDPSLLWECSCDIPQKYKNEKKCRLHENENADRISDAFNRGLVKIKYDNIEIFWRDLPSLWPPSIDSLYFVKILKENCGIDIKRAKKILDVGAGTGFLGLYIFKNLVNNIENITYSDLCLTPLFSSLYNSYFNLGVNGVKRSNFVMSSGLTEFIKKNEKFDVIVCAPPYLPTFTPDIDSGKVLLFEQTVAGTYLLDDVITNGGSICKTLILSYSNIATPEYEISIERAKKWHDLRDNKIKTIGEIEVPFRVTHALYKEDYMKKLLNYRKKYFIEKEDSEDSPFKYWHKIKYCMIHYE